MARRQDQHAGVAAERAQLLEHVDAVEPGQHQVEQHQLVGPLAQGLERLAAVVHHIRAIARMRERIAEAEREIDLVLDDQEIVLRRRRGGLARGSGAGGGLGRGRGSAVHGSGPRGAVEASSARPGTVPAAAPASPTHHAELRLLALPVSDFPSYFARGATPSARACMQRPIRRVARHSTGLGTQSLGDGVDAPRGRGATRGERGRARGGRGRRRGRRGGRACAGEGCR